MRKLNVKIEILCILTVIFLSGCQSNGVADSSIKKESSIPSTVVQDAAEIDVNGESQVELEKNVNIIPKAILDKNGVIVIGKKGDNNSEIGLLNTVTNETKIIEVFPSSMYFGISFDSDSYVVFYIYEIDKEFAKPEMYYIYNKETQTLDTIDISKLINEEVSRSSSTTDVSIDSNHAYVYFELQVETPKVSGNTIKSSGVKIFRYSLESKEVEEYIDGFSPKITKDGVLYYLLNDKDGVSLYKLEGKKKKQLVRKNVTEFTVFENNVLLIEKEIDKDGMSESKLIIIRDHVNAEILFEGIRFEFWDLQMNNEYIFWQQSSAPLYIYDIKNYSFIHVTDDFGARFSSISDDNTILWLHIIEDGKFDENKTRLLKFIKLE